MDLWVYNLKATYAAQRSSKPAAVNSRLMVIAVPSSLSITLLVALFIKTSLVATIPFIKTQKRDFLNPLPCFHVVTSFCLLICGQESTCSELYSTVQVGVNVRLCKYTAQESNNSRNCCLGRGHSSALFGQVSCVLKTYWSNWFLLGINRNHPSSEGFIVLYIIQTHAVHPSTHGCIGSQYEKAHSL